jgi:hypothetical protein
MHRTRMDHSATPGSAQAHESRQPTTRNTTTPAHHHPRPTTPARRPSVSGAGVGRVAARPPRPAACRAGRAGTAVRELT